MQQNRKDNIQAGRGPIGIYPQFFVKHLQQHVISESNMPYYDKFLVRNRKQLKSGCAGFNFNLVWNFVCALETILKHLCLDLADS
jgi:hypothetical protein